MMAFRLAIVEHLVDIGGIAELLRRASDRTAMSWSAPAPGTRHRHGMPRSRRRCRSWPWRRPLIGHLQIRNRGTIGGSLAHADPAAEYPAVGAGPRRHGCTAVSTAGSRAIAGRATSSTACGRRRSSPTRSLADVRFPVWQGRMRVRRRGVRPPARRLRHRRRRRRRSSADDAGTVTRCAIAMFGLGPTPLRAERRRGAALVGTAASDRRAAAELGRAGRRATSTLPPATSRPVPEYRLRIGAAMVERAIDDGGSTAARTERRAMADVP